MMITLPDDTARRLERAAARRGISPEALAVETIDSLATGDEGDEGDVNDAFLALVDEVIADHRPILDRLAT
jgi:hypothetical protein